mgnify:FL=1|tara:strand:+ start:215 stop:373 length:159 start_codon:yes stop_codon:yes gene_type:complete
MIIKAKYKIPLFSSHPLVENNFSIHYIDVYVKFENEINTKIQNLISYKIIEL